MPAFNAGKYIRQAVQSILDQSYSNWELIIVNDGSTDHTVSELGYFADARIKVYEQANSGQCNAANKAYSYSKGELVKFMDADDLLSANFLKSQVEILQNTSNCIASANWGRFYGDNLDTFRAVTTTQTGNTGSLDWLIGSMTGQQVMLQCGLWLIPKTILNRSGLWKENLTLINDFEFFIRVLLYADEIRHAPDALLYYRSGIANSLSAQVDPVGVESAFISIDMATSYLLERENSNRVRKIAADCFQSFIYDYYPLCPDLIRQAKKKVAGFGGSALQLQASGFSLFLIKMGGWRFMKWLRFYWLKMIS